MWCTWIVKKSSPNFLCQRSAESFWKWFSVRNIILKHFLKLGLIFDDSFIQVNTGPTKKLFDCITLLFLNLHSVGCASLCSTSEVMLTMIVYLLKSSTQMTATLRFNRVTICLRLYWSQRIYPVRFQPSLNSIEIDLVCWLLLTQFFWQSLPRVVISTDLFVVPSNGIFVGCYLEN